jgi:hypothetical protein
VNRRGVISGTRLVKLLDDRQENPSSPRRLTLVTGLFDLAKREGNPGRRTEADYLRHGEFIFALNQDIAFFAEPESAEVIRARRRAHGLLRRTHIFVTSLEAMPAYALADSIREARSRHAVINANPAKDTPLYIALTWSKFAMLQEAMTVDPFGGTHFAWIDLGIAQVARVRHCLADGVFSRPSDKVKLLMMKSFAPEDLADRRDYFSYLRGHVAGGYISAGVSCLRRLCESFQAEALASLEQGYGPSEEQLLPVLAARHPALFEFYYGDYDHIFENYSRTRGSAENLLFQMRFCRARRDFRRGCEIGSRVLASHGERTFDADPAHLSALLDEYFIAAWHLEYPGQEAARRVARYYVQLIQSDPAFRAAFLRDEEHIRSNFSFLREEVLPQSL